MLTLESGLPASLDASWSRPKSWPTWGGLTMEVIGERGVLSMDAFRQNLERFDDRGRQYSLLPWTEGGDPGLVHAFIDAVCGGTEPLVTGEDGVKALEVALCAYASAKRGAPVACPGGLRE
jgi:predicted dehydrogenase